MDQQQFKNHLPRRARTEFATLEKLSASLSALGRTCGVLSAHAQTEFERQEWLVVGYHVRQAVISVLCAIEAIVDGADTYDAVDRQVDVSRLYRLIGEADALGRLHIRTVGTAAHTDIEERIDELEWIIERLVETHENNNMSRRVLRNLGIPPVPQNLSAPSSG